LVEGFGAEAEMQTQKFIKAGESQIFQATFISDDLLVMCDVIQLDEETNKWDVYEIKGTTSKDRKKEDYYWDIAFQNEVLKRSGIDVGKLMLVELNKEFRKSGEIDPNDLFISTDLSIEIESMKEEIRGEINRMKELLNIAEEPSECECRYKSRNNQCEAISLFYPDIPEYSVYDLSRIRSGSKKLRNFVENGILAIKQIPDNSDLTPIQYNQVRVEKNDNEILDADGIKGELEQLEYPLYFLDYETFPSAIPVFDHCFPFQQVPFQFSLHVLVSAESELEHYEFVHTGSGNPIPHLVEKLRKVISNSGSVIVWNKSFEGKCNNDMAEIAVEHKDFLLSINDRFYDLRDIFSKQYYVRREFKGSTSIKYVLPILVPELSYEELEIRDGGMASSSYKKMLSEGITNEQKQVIKNQLLEYCKLDTLAMVRILEEVMKKVN
jgi:hypothetical protein